MTARGAAIAKEDLTAKLVATFKQLISEGSLVPGAKLPSERELAESFGVARSSLRQALKVLEVMGVISQRVGDGTYLNTAAPSILSESLDFLIVLDGISFYELMEARLIVEPELAARAAERASSSDLSELHRLLKSMDDCRDDLARFISLDVAFHNAVFRAAGNRVCTLMFTVVQKSLHKLIDVTAHIVDPEHTLRLHQRIYTAIRKRDPEAARRRMAEHLVDARELLANAAKSDAQVRVAEACARAFAKT
jgi:GntR family transcriptional repressor for pyruvate dehydrogenase complex